MASQLGYSDFAPAKNNNNNKPEYENKKKKKSSKKVEELLNYIEGFSDNEDGDDLEDYNKETEHNFPPNPILTKQPEEKVENDDPISIEGFSKLNDNEAINNNYYNNYIPYYTKSSNTEIPGSKDELMTKLNYMIHLLEENKDEKTHNVTEELVLYLFLGVFVIFVVDSFAKVGKYTRTN
jgi:hypothetical protein